MTYPDRLRDATYTSPSGIVTSFDFTELSREITHRIGAFEFSGINGTLHQDRGVSGEVYPLTIYLHGLEYDLAADTFLDSLKEIGPGFLEHPRWGRRRVQVLSITQTENAAERGGQAVFEIQFQETLEREFPLTATALNVQTTALADTAQESAIDNFSDQVDVTDLSNELAHEQEILLSAEKVDSALAGIVTTDQDISERFRTAINNVLNNAAEYVQDPFEYATQITNAIRVVAEIPGKISSKLQGFQNLLNVLQTRDMTGATLQNKNAVLVDELLGTMAVVGVSESISQALSETSALSRDQSGRAIISVPNVDTGFQTREELAAVVTYLQDNSTGLINYLDQAQGIFENNILSESYIQSVQSYVQTWQVAGTVIKSALGISFELPIKRIKILDKPDTIIGLSFEFYGNVDDVVLDYFILTNNLTGNEIIEVPRGREIVFYE
jgi:prophage DNA circulation protein